MSGAAPEIDVSFTLDPVLLAKRKAATARRVHTIQIPAARAVGFAILCAMAIVQDLGLGVPFPQPGLLLLVVVNLLYATLSWVALRVGYGHTGRLDLGLLLLHLDVLVWLLNLHHLEQSHLFFGYFLLMRVADQVGAGFRRAIYFNHVVCAAYVVYAVWLSIYEPARLHGTERLGIVSMMYLLGCYLAFTGSVSERLRNRTRQAVRTARGLVDTLEQKTQALEQQTQALEQQALDLERARQQAEQASLAKSQFLATISHEIRTPMNGILGTTELMLSGTLTPAQRHYALTAHKSATALLALIDNVLDLSRLEAGKLTLDAVSFDLRELVVEAVDLMIAIARDKPIALGYELDPRLPERLQGDPVRMRQIVVNLLHNAVKFTERGRVEVQVAIVAEAPEALRLRICVRDTGVGIARDQFDAVFEAFTQIDASSTRRHGGSGLGLSIVKELTEMMGGELGVESRPGQGSSFWVEISLARATAAAPAPEEHLSGADGELFVRVLLAEDDVVNQLVVEEMLRMMGCAVDVVGDGDAARAAAARAAYDLIFMDLHMPVMDGYEATHWIRRDEGERGGAHTPIVALTADALAGDRERCIASGMDDYMTKPVSSALLAAAIERWTGRRTAPITQW